MRQRLSWLLPRTSPASREKPPLAVPETGLRRGLRVAMVAYSFYENDGRVMRYAQALTLAGAEVVVYCLRRTAQPTEVVLDGVRVVRIQARVKNEASSLRYLFRIMRFLAVATWKVAGDHFRRPYQLVHVHSVPDFLVLSAVIPRMLGARVILDIHDILPEFYAAKFSLVDSHWMVAVLRSVERLSARLCDHVIVANDLWRDKLTARSVASAKCSACINYPDLEVFRHAPRTAQLDGIFLLVYPGSLNWHQGLDLAIEAVALARPQAPGLRLEIYGEGGALLDLKRLVRERELSGQVVFHPPLPMNEIAMVMARADVGVVPKRDDGFGGEAFSTKTLEFMALGVPVLVAATRIDRHYFNDSLVLFFEPGNAAALAEAMLVAYRDRDALALRAETALAFARENAWGVKRHDYLALVQRLLAA